MFKISLSYILFFLSTITIAQSDLEVEIGDFYIQDSRKALSLKNGLPKLMNAVDADVNDQSTTFSPFNYTNFTSDVMIYHETDKGFIAVSSKNDGHMNKPYNHLVIARVYDKVTFKQQKEVVLSKEHFPGKGASYDYPGPNMSAFRVNKEENKIVVCEVVGGGKRKEVVVLKVKVFNYDLELQNTFEYKTSTLLKSINIDRIDIGNGKVALMYDDLEDEGAKSHLLLFEKGKGVKEAKVKPKPINGGIIEVHYLNLINNEIIITGHDIAKLASRSKKILAGYFYKTLSTEDLTIKQNLSIPFEEGTDFKNKGFLTNYKAELSEIIYLKDGMLIVLQEQGNSVNFSGSGELVVIKINKAGELVYQKKVDKYEAFLDGTFHNYTYLMNDDYIYFVFNDSRKTFTANDGEAHSTSYGNKGRNVVSYVKLSLNDGTQERVKLMDEDADRGKGLWGISTCEERISDDKIVVCLKYGKKKRRMVTIKIK